MPRSSVPRRRSRRELESDDEEEDDYSSSLGTPEAHDSSRKKARLSASTNLTSPSPETGSPTTHGHLSQNHRIGMLDARRSRQKHRPGSIVRVKLENFVTYTAVEFFPGPSLNMVIGPNGTGKSTLVCAICLGLGWETNTLGRAKAVGEFVKHGAREAHIEIELAKDGKRFKENVVIKCTIKRDGNKSVFTVGRQSYGKRAVKDIARSLNIQIDNLCQFLPQDKVVEFAAMTPIELLNSTQRAVASEEMSNMHEQLKRIRKDQKEVQLSVNTDQDMLNNLESRQRMQEADVQRLREREDVVIQINRMEKSLPTVKYKIARKQHAEMKQNSRDMQADLQRLKREAGPALQAVDRKRGYRDQIEKAVRHRRDLISKAEQKADAIDRQFQTLQQDSSALDAEITSEKDSVKPRRNELAKLDRTVNELKMLLQNRPPEIDAAAYNEKMRSAIRQMDQAENTVKELKARQAQVAQSGRDTKRKIQEAEVNLQNLESQAGKQTSKLNNLSRDSAKLYHWIQEHQDEFEKHVYGPPIVECSVRDTRYVDMIESLIQRGQMLSFTAQTRNDFAKLSRIAHSTLRLSEVNIKEMSFGMEKFPSPQDEELKTYGFHGWARTYLNGPDPVIAMLCGEARLHDTAVSLQDTSPEVFQRLERSDSRIVNWVTKTTTYRISRRKEYGPGATSTSTRPVRRAQIWTEQPVDPSAKRETQQRILEMRAEIDGYQTEFNEIQETIESKRRIVTECKKDHTALQKEKGEKQKAAGEFKALPNKIEMIESKMASIRQEIHGTAARIRQLADQQDKIAMQRAQKALQYTEAVGVLRAAHGALHEAELMLIEANSDLQILEEKNKEVCDMIMSKEVEIQTLQQRVQELGNHARALLAQTQEIIAQDDVEESGLREYMNTLPPDLTVEDLVSEIEGEKARLELMHEGSGNTIKEFEARKKKIDDLTTKLAAKKASLEEIDGEGAKLRNVWEPELDRIVGLISDSFSHNMGQINCAGEVGVHKDEDFDQWSIGIRVKFRESEPLAILTSHRQSGGERAVSTIFYLMSLQSLTPSPFRVVDEINQGMDPRNERLVHKRMVDIACGEDDSAAPNHRANSDENEEGQNDNDEEGQNTSTGGSQYFLITPKLLPDLEYKRGMRVLCIASGEYMPAEAGTVNFKAACDIMRGMKGIERNGMDSSLVNGNMGESSLELGNTPRMGVAAG